MKKKDSLSYSVWNGMKNRCNNRNVPNYSYYGGRGISYCPRWEEFDNFLKDMGEKVPGMTLDRIDNDKEYCPENCRWVSMYEQSRNKRNSVKLTWEGKTLCLTDWSEKLGLHRTTLQKRLDRWTLDKSFTQPKRKWIRKNEN